MAAENELWHASDLTIFRLSEALAAGPLVLQLVRMEQFTTDEIDELHKLIDRLDGEADTKNQRPRHRRKT